MQTGQLRKSAGQGSLGSKKAVALSIRLNTGSAEPRVDSRALARLFGNHHRNVMVLIQKHAEQFKKFGHLLFETQVGERKQGGGKAERYARLNEDQAIYLLTLAKNNDRVVPLKAELVAAFRMARDRASVRATQYLPLYHSVHDAVEALIHRARECGSTTPDAIFHGNANRMLNSVLGITSGERENLTVAQQLTLSSLRGLYGRRGPPAPAPRRIRAVPRFPRKPGSEVDHAEASTVRGSLSCRLQGAYCALWGGRAWHVAD